MRHAAQTCSVVPSGGSWWHHEHLLVGGDALFSSVLGGTVVCESVFGSAVICESPRLPILLHAFFTCESETPRVKERLYREPVAAEGVLGHTARPRSPTQSTPLHTTWARAASHQQTRSRQSCSQAPML